MVATRSQIVKIMAICPELLESNRAPAKASHFCTFRANRRKQRNPRCAISMYSPEAASHEIGRATQANMGHSVGRTLAVAPSIVKPRAVKYKRSNYTHKKSDAAVNAAYMYAKSEAAFAPYGGTAAVFAKIVSGERSFLGKNEAHMLINRDMDIAAEIKAELSLIKGDDSQATQKSIRVKFNKLVTIMRIALRKHMIASKNAITIKRQGATGMDLFMLVNEDFIDLEAAKQPNTVPFIVPKTTHYRASEDQIKQIFNFIPKDIYDQHIGDSVVVNSLGIYAATTYKKGGFGFQTQMRPILNVAITIGKCKMYARNVVSGSKVFLVKNETVNEVGGEV